MKLSRFVLCAAVVVLSGSMLVIADEGKPTTRPHRRGGPAKLIQPWDHMSSLSDEQKRQIIKLHEEANEKVRAIRDQERKDETALLKPEQQAEMRKVEADLKQAAAERAAQNRERMGKEKGRKDNDDKGL